MTSFNITPKIEISLWISDGNIQVFVGDDDSPVEEISLESLILQEVISHAIPASAQRLKDIQEIKDDDGNIANLHDALYRVTNLVYNVLEKSK
jgi:hypothetical protein